MRELNLIQTQLVSTKCNYNDFSKFNYRSLEDIMSNVKPLLKQYGCTVTFSDEIVLIGDRYYIKATCYLKNESGELETSTAYAREPDGLKGMSEPQVTGTASSYARKYAVCSLLAIDDNKDIDSMDNRNHKKKDSNETPQPNYTTTSTQPIQTKTKDEWVQEVKNQCNAIWKQYDQQGQATLKSYVEWWIKKINEKGYDGNEFNLQQLFSKYVAKQQTKQN